jgi:hypothetical protein
MKEITANIKDKRSKQAIKKIKSMLDNCKNKVHLNIIARYLYLYTQMFPERVKDCETLSLIKGVEFKLLNIKDYYERSASGHMQKSK